MFQFSVVVVALVWQTHGQNENGSVSSFKGRRLCGMDASSCCRGSSCGNKNFFGVGTCSQASDGGGCAHNGDCTSGWCDGGLMNQCVGTCKSKWADGTCGAPKMVTYDYNICLTGDGRCGCCGLAGLPDGKSCTTNSDCRSGWCEGRGSCMGTCEPKLADGTKVSCTDALNVLSGGCDYNKCEAGNGKCGYCGSKSANGRPCSANSDCAEGACRVPTGTVATSAFCGGSCVPKQSDGYALPRLSFPIYFGGSPSWYDYSECKAGAGKCGICGVTVPEGAVCSATSDCAGDLCCSGRVSVDCSGRCVKKSPSACPSLISLQDLEAAVNTVTKWAGDFIGCMTDGLLTKQLGSGADALTCKMGASYSDMTMDLECAALSPENARRVAASDDSGDWARRLGYASPAAARRLGTVGLTLGRRLSPEEQEERRLIGYGTAAQPKQMKLGCSEKAQCKGGANVNVFADVDFEPKVVAKGEMKNSKITVEMQGEITASAGFGVIAAGACSHSWVWTYPKMPKPVATYCFYALCMTITIQGFLEITLDGQLAAEASAEYHTTYSVTGSATIKLDTSQLDQSASSTMKVTKTSEWWKLNAAGTVSAAITAKIGPVVSFILLPGVFVSFNPHVSAEASLYGEMKYMKTSGDVPDGITPASWPTTMDCTRKPNKLFNKVKQSKTKGNTSKGEGFSVEAGSLEDDGNNICLAAGLALIAGVDITGIGPPPQFDMQEVLDATCNEVAKQIAESPGLASIDCMGKAVMGSDFQGVASGGYALCKTIMDAIPSNPLDALTFVETEVCFDIWSDYIGGEGCLCNVGCNRRSSEPECQPKDIVINHGMKSRPLSIALLLTTAFTMLCLSQAMQQTLTS